jgi:hypothetical protein
MMRTVVVSTLVSSIFAVAAAAAFVRVSLDEARTTSTDARTLAAEAKLTAAEASKFASDMGVAIATTPSAEKTLAPVVARLDGIRAELDEMQTQIRLLKLMAR